MQSIAGIFTERWGGKDAGGRWAACRLNNRENE